MGGIATRVAERFEALTIPREFHLPANLRGVPPQQPEGTDLSIWTWDQDGRVMGIAFAGKSDKPVFYHRFRDEDQRQRVIDETVRNRKQYIERMKQRRQERTDFQHSLAVGDIMASSWGYDQTNVNFYEVTEVRGKEVILREVASKVTSHGAGSDSVVAVPGQYIGEPMRRRPGGSGERVYVRISDSQTASKWDGHPMHETAGGYGH